MRIPLLRSGAPTSQEAAPETVPEASSESTLVGIRLPRENPRTVQSVQSMLSGFGHIGTFSLEMVGDLNGLRMMARCAGTGATSFMRSLRGYYPQAGIEEMSSEEDPLTLVEGERAWRRTLRIEGHEALPLMTFENEMGLPGTDPLLGIFGSMSSMGPGERVVARLVLTGKDRSWAEQYVAAAMSGVGSANQLAYDAARQRDGGPNKSGGAPIALVPIAGAAMLGINIYTSWNDGEILKAFLVGGGAVAACLIGGYVYFRFLRPKKDVYLDPRAVERRVGGAVFDAEVELYAIQDAGGGEGRARIVLEDVSAAYSHYNNSLGSWFESTEIEEVDRHVLAASRKLGPPLVPTGLGAFKLLFSSTANTSVMGSLEAATLWHPPASEDDVHSMERMTARTLTPRYYGVENGAFVGTNKNGDAVLLPPEAMSSHHFYVARTRMGKSTLMRHAVEHKMQEKAAERDNDAIVVIDPHSDLVHGLMELCPPEIADKVKVIDLGDLERVVGLNLLDPLIFADRDLTCDGIVRVAKGLWDNWGSRMQNILEHLAKSMHEANTLSGWPRSEQYTILDGHDMLGIGDESVKARQRMLSVIRDPYLRRWWESEFGNWDNRMKVEACAPVQTRLAYYASSLNARRVLGQAESTLDIRKTIQEGGILLVASASAYVGRDVASLLGACILNLVDAVVRNQGTLPPDQRRGCLVVVDEMQSIPGVDYEGMLSEVGKFGGSLVLATQSLTKLDELSPTMRDTILANIGCLCVFQVSGADAIRLRGEIGADRLEAYDIVSLPRHECYVKLSSLPGGVSTMSMRVRPPSEGNAESLAKIKEKVVEYTRSVGEVDDMLKARVDAMSPKRRDRQIHVRSSDGSGPVYEPEPDIVEADNLATEEGPAERRRGEAKMFEAKRAEAERGGSGEGSVENRSSNA